MPDLVFTAANVRAKDTFALMSQFEAAAAVELGEACELLDTGAIRKTADDSAGFEGIIVSTENKGTTAAAGEMVGVVSFGDVVGFEDLTPGALYYLSANAGNIADTGTIAIAYAVDEQTLRVMPALADRPYQ
jgi:hypothetical protein